MKQLSQCFVLITGASRGIGLEIARAFAKEGCQLYLTCSNSFEELKQIASELSSTYQIICKPFQTDMGNPKEVEALFSQISSLDILINNAGISYVGLLHEMEVEQWQHILNVNLSSSFYTCKHSIPLMLKNHAGKIIQISSIWGNAGASMEVAYSATKGGINSFTKALAKELAPSNIQVNAVSCGVIDTAMNSCFSKEELDVLCEEIPAGRMGTPSEVAELVLQLATAPAYLTGQIITMDGGFL